MRMLCGLGVLLAAGMLAGCLPDTADTGDYYQKPGTPDSWSSMAKRSGTPLLRGPVTPSSDIRFPDDDIEATVPDGTPSVIQPVAPVAPTTSPGLPKATPDISIEAALKDKTQVYVVKKGDALSKIAKRFQITSGLIRRLNNMPDSHSLIHIDERLRVAPGPFKVTVDTKSLQLRVYLGQTVIKTYPVGIGTQDTETPTGRMRILDMVRNPRWDYGGMHAAPGDPENPVGTRWIKIARSYGVHGTNEPSSIGQSTSRGCIRMYNRHVEEVYDVMRIGGEVIVQ